MTSKKSIISTIIGLFIAAVIVVPLFAAMSYNHTELCKEYCVCSITNNCSYTFDYKDVVDCECGK
jgi:hypothetical protein